MESKPKIHSKPKPQILVDQMTQMAMRLGTGGRLPGVRELSAQFGVAKATVSDALDQLEARGIITRRQGSGIYVAPTAGCRTIGLVFGSNIFDGSVSPVYRMLLERCMARAAEGRDQFSFYLDMPQPTAVTGAVGVHLDLINDVRSGKLSGLLFTYNGTEKQRQWQRSLTIPTVAYIPTDRCANTVGIDYGGLVRAGVLHLAAHGCRRIALVTVLGFLREEGFEEDLTAYSAALREVGGRRKHPELIWEHRPNDDAPHTEATAKLWETQGRQAVESLFVGKTRPDGLVVTDDMMCRGVLAGLEKLGLKPGRDVQIATHYTHESDSLRGRRSALTRLEIDPADIVEALFKSLELQMIDGKSVAAVLIKPTLLAPKITKK